MEKADYIHPPSGAQLSFMKLLRMSWSSLQHQSVASWLQIATIAATAAFLTFLLGEISILRMTKDLPGVTYPEGKMEQLIWILAISLLVVTISNITSMLLSVTKRFREIGTMKCIGAFDYTILRLFLMEALMLGGVGAFIGSIVGSLISLLAALVQYGSVIQASTLITMLTGWSLISIAIVVLLSFIGAAYPAWKAAKMLPIEAMRAT